VCVRVCVCFTNTFRFLGSALGTPLKDHLTFAHVQCLHNQGAQQKKKFASTFGESWRYTH